MSSLLKSICSVRRFVAQILFPRPRLHNICKGAGAELRVCTTRYKSDIAVLPTCGRQTSSVKFAIFQVSEAGARAHLICLEMSSLQSAAELEQWLRMNIGPRTDVTLLGRFASVHFISSEADVESLIFGEKWLETPIECLQR